MADSDAGKLFVGGISRDTSDVTLKDHFSKYGDVSYAAIAKDRLTGVPRGFGFITFSDTCSAEKALRDSHHLINGRTVDVKRASPRKVQPQHYQHQHIPSPIHSQTSNVMGRNSDGSYGDSNSDKTKKIFVGGLSSSLTEEEFRSYFEKLGTVTDVVVMHDNITNRPRGFGFITFDSEEAVDKIMHKNHHELAGKRVEVKRAIPREATKNSNNGNNPRFGGGSSFQEAGQTATDGSYWPRGPAYGSYPGPLPVSAAYPGYYYNNGALYSGGYPIGGGYGVYGYGMPVVPSRNPWGGAALRPGPGRPVNYGTGFYPSGVNGGFPMMGMVGPFSGMMQPGAHHHFSNGQVHQKDATLSMNGARSDGNASVKMGKGDAKNFKTPDTQAQPKVPTVSQSC